MICRKQKGINVCMYVPIQGNNTPGRKKNKTLYIYWKTEVTTITTYNMTFMRVERKSGTKGQTI